MSEETQTSLASLAQEPAVTDTVAETAQNSEVVENEVTDADVTTASEDDTGDDVDSDTEAEVEKPRAKKGFEKRISKEVARKNEALREAEYWKRVALERNGEVTSPAATVPVAQDKPKFSDYNDLEAYTEAVTDWKLERKLQEVTQQSKQNTVKTTYESRVKEFEKVRPDFQEVLAYSDVLISQPVTELIMESDVGPAVVLFLAENEDEAERINKLSPARQLAEIGKIEAKLSTKAAANPAKKTVSQAPAPVKPVSGAAPVAKKSLADPSLSPEEWIKMRNKERGYR